MQWNKKTASLLAVLSLVLGGAGAIGLQAHAQQNAAASQPAQIQTQSGRQDNFGIDKESGKPEESGTPESALGKEGGVETKSGIEANENLPGGGHQDQAGVNVDRQFNGVE